MKLLYAFASLLILVVSLIALDESEVLARRDAAVIDDIGSAVVEADPGTVNPALDGRIVHVSGMLEAANPVTDPDTGVSVRGLSLHRYVEMFQWAHQVSFHTSHHNRVWSPDQIRGGPTLVDPKAPENPVMPFQTQTFNADAPHLGAYQLDDALITAARQYRPTQLVDGSPEAGNMLYQGYDVQNPDIGDVMTWYHDSPYQQISVIGIQSNGKLVPVHFTPTGEDLVLLRHSSADASALVAAIQQHIAARRGIFRFRVFLAATFGMALALLAAGPHNKPVLLWTATPCCAVAAMAAVMELHVFVPRPSHGLVMLCGTLVTVLCVSAVNKLAKMRFSLAPRWA